MDSTKELLNMMCEQNKRMENVECQVLEVKQILVEILQRMIEMDGCNNSPKRDREGDREHYTMGYAKNTSPSASREAVMVVGQDIEALNDPSPNVLIEKFDGLDEACWENQPQPDVVQKDLFCIEPLFGEGRLGTTSVKEVTVIGKDMEAPNEPSPNVLDAKIDRFHEACWDDQPQPEAVHQDFPNIESFFGEGQLNTSPDEVHVIHSSDQAVLSGEPMRRRSSSRNKKGR